MKLDEVFKSQDIAVVEKAIVNIEEMLNKWASDARCSVEKLSGTHKRVADRTLNRLYQKLDDLSR